MNKKQKNTPIRAVQIMKKEFFANRFGVKPRDLSWGIIISQNEDSEKSLNAALLFKEDKNLFIDILNDRISSLINVCGCQTTAVKASFNRTRGGYTFSHQRLKTFISNKDIEKAYRNKLFNKKLTEEAAKLQ